MTEASRAVHHEIAKTVCIAAALRSIDLARNEHRSVPRIQQSALLQRTGKFQKITRGGITASRRGEGNKLNE